MKMSIDRKIMSSTGSILTKASSRNSERWLRTFLLFEELGNIWASPARMPQPCIALSVMKVMVES